MMPTDFVQKVAWRVSRAVWRRIPATLRRQTHPTIPGPIDRTDEMLGARRDRWMHYAAVGLDAIRNLDASLASAGRSWADLRTVLDLPCGHGRVLRWIVQRVPPERVTACDVSPDMLAFCSSAFGVTPVLAEPTPANLRLPERYDLIWVGSLLTHFPAEEGWQFLTNITPALAPGGVLVFTTHDLGCLANHPERYGSQVRHAHGKALADAERTGFAFVPYTRHGRYGTAFHNPDSFKQAIADRYDDRLRLVRFASHGWDAHQDVWAFQRHS